MKKSFLFCFYLLAAAFFFTCSNDVQSPFSRDKAKVFLLLQSSDKAFSDSAITDTVGNIVRIGVGFFMAAYFDSVLITAGKSITTLDTFFVCKKADIKDDTVWYSCSFASAGARNINVTGYVEGGYRPSASGTISILEKPIPKPPHAISQTVSLKEDSITVITLSAIDYEGLQIAAWQIIDTVKHGILIGSANNYTYTPQQYYHGPDTFTFRASNGTKWGDTAVVAITIVHVNHAPLWKQSSVNLSTKEGKTIDFDMSTVFERDPDGDSVKFSWKSGVGSIKADGKTWTWSPDFKAAASSPAASVITATDNGTPGMYTDITLSISVADSVCKLTLNITIGQGSFSTTPAGTTFDPSTEVQISATPSKDYVFKAWQGDSAISDSTKAQCTIIMNSDKRISASFLKTAETVTLNIGESYVHGSCYAEGYYFLSTRTSPAKLLRINANNLGDHAEITFSAGHDNADQIVYVPSKRKLYVVFGSNTRNVVAEADPFTMTYIEEKIFDTANANSISNNCQSIASDGQYLYVLANRRPTKVLKYSLATFSSTPVAIATLDGSMSLGHAIYYENGYLYLSNYGYGLWIAKMDANTMQVLDSASMTGESFTDDFAITQDYIFEGLEAPFSSANNGAIYRIAKNNLSQVFKINTGAKGDSIYYAGQCYGTLNALGYIWAIFASRPGTLTRIDPISLQFVNYRLEYNTPNEIISDGKRLFITYWAQDPGVIQAFDQSYLIGKEIP